MSREHVMLQTRACRGGIKKCLLFFVVERGGEFPRSMGKEDENPLN